CSQDLQLPLTF
nr:immunoglobulin light chain junction region [Macaca mulatta]